MASHKQFPARMARFLAAAVAACAGAASAVEVKYSLWDTNQLPAYRQCAADFEKANPGITIRILQTGWADYWTLMATSFVSGTAPDVLANHLMKYPEYAKNGLIVDLSPYIRRDKIDPSVYAPGLYELWGRDGKQYGLPKDWDTVAMVVNLDHARKAGVTLAELQNMDWNPRDGGSFENVVRRLTFDADGNNALSPRFDKRRVATYGYQNPGHGGMMGQTDWSHFAVSNGFRFQDRPWEPTFYYDDPKLVETLAYIAGLSRKGLSAPYEHAKPMGSNAMFTAAKVAMVPEGSWMITFFRDNAKFQHAWVPLPVGPTGTRATMFNGLADSIWSGSKVKEEAWQWVKYLGSAACQQVVASHGVVFPAIKGMTERTIAAHQARGLDSSAFFTMARAKTFLAPIADNGGEVDHVISTALEAIWIGTGDPATLMRQANTRANEIAKR
ncbi:ABC transporter substrate-binding protein [Piscinibacter sp.]|uniref:ABC transporter substrate-binding protein n=1 Tax=Piscinibacter sp. TaxID=1903157 RepID=UPI002D1010ED|nr:sugar ABC transporter substrate-binding protein [Albitalea sp.]HUG22677.1 sugar ABC transporter substrate-binding protein [Albitalea sp.]